MGEESFLRGECRSECQFGAGGEETGERTSSSPIVASS